MKALRKNLIFDRGHTYTPLALTALGFLFIFIFVEYGMKRILINFWLILSIQHKQTIKQILNFRRRKVRSLPNQGGLKTIFNGTQRGQKWPKRGQRRGAEVIEERGKSLQGGGLYQSFSIVY